MSATTIAIQILLADSDVNAAVSSRVYPVVAPQEKALPYIVASTIYEDQDTVLEGHRDGYFSRVSIHAVAGSAPAADALGEAVKAAMSVVVHHPVTDANASPIAIATAWKEGTDMLDYTDDRTIFRRVMDYRLKWIPA